MSMALTALLGMLVIAGSAATTYMISISRERLWLKSKKAEELYQKAEETCFDLCGFFRDRYELSQMVLTPHDGREIALINRRIVDLKILVGLYFPGLGHRLAGAVAATATAFDQLRLAQASDFSNRPQTLQMLDYAVSETKDSFERLKADILLAGQIDSVGRIASALFNRRPRQQSERILSAAA
jgi:hypothetical protein